MNSGSLTSINTNTVEAEPPTVTAPKGRNKRTHAQAAEEPAEQPTEQPAEQPAITKKGKNLFLTIQINSMY
jgi:hypothetical protein